MLAAGDGEFGENVPDAEVEIIIVDNGSMDRTAQVCGTGCSSYPNYKRYIDAFRLGAAMKFCVEC